MQLLQSSTDALIKPLSTVIGIVERRSTMPILANILMAKKGSRIEFIATDLEVQITTHAEIGMGEESESVAVLARKLFDILKSLPSAATLNAQLDSGKIMLQCAGSQFSLQTLAGDVFPLVEQPTVWGKQFTLPQKSLRRLFNMVSFAMAKQDIRYYLNGILMVIEPNLVRAVATDGHRLAHMAEDVAGLVVEQEQQYILPSKTVIEMQRLLDDSDEPVKISVAQSQIRFEFGDIEFISKLVEGRFPDFKRVIPTDYERHITLNREAFQRSLQRAMILVSNDRLHGIKLSLGNNVLRISAHNQENEEAKIELDVDYAYEPLEIGFNGAYLLDVVATVKTEDIILSVKPSAANASVVFTLLNEENFKYVVMPLRI